MPQLSPAELVNPSAGPSVYPGHPIQDDTLLVGNWKYSMTARHGLRVGNYAVKTDGGPLGKTEGACLDDVLAALDVPPAADRYPVVAVGSNASPGQLAHKFGDAWPAMVIPLTGAQVPFMRVAYSAHINKSGYMPYSPSDDATNASRLIILWLDDGQLQRVNETEPNYHTATFTGERHRAVLSSGEPLSSYTIYRSRWDLFRISRNAPALAASSQESVFAELGKLDWFRDLVPEVDEGPAHAMRALSADPDRRQDVTDRFTEDGHRISDGLGDIEYRPRTYDGGARAAGWGIASAAG